MKKVLVVDDTKNIRILLTKCLQMEGFEVVTAADGREALDMFKREDFDLAFLDIKMPNFSGTDVLKAVRDMGKTTPVIIITAYATIKNAVECTQMGAVAYLQKPFTLEKIRNVLSSLNMDMLGGSAGQRQLADMERLINEGCYMEAMNSLKKMLPEKSLDKEIYLLLSKASSGLGNTQDEIKYLKLYKAFDD